MKAFPDVYVFSVFQTGKKKNISHDAFGTKFGRLHMQKQDLGKLQTRKMKGLRKRKGPAAPPGDETEAKASKTESPDVQPEPTAS